LLAQVEKAGVEVVKLILHVGVGTFAPIRGEDFSIHKMHAERFVLPETSASTLNRVRRAGGRIVAVGTTSARVLETVAGDDGILTAASGETRLFIYPPYRFKAVDLLLTNFHLPRSTLLLLVSAFAGREKMLAAYRQAVEKRYRFYSYGDAMLLGDDLVPESANPG
jgi:S-adenosylmethionine:tRNA ribosyltransferase-isomerase